MFIEVGPGKFVNENRVEYIKFKPKHVFILTTQDEYKVPELVLVALEELTMRS